MVPRSDHDRPRPEPARARAAAQSRATGRALGPAPASIAAWGTSLDAAITAAGGDQATRIAVMRQVGDVAGNRAAGRLAERARLTVQREEDDNPYDDADAGAPATPAGYTLTNARFTPFARLQEIANGGTALKPGDPAPAVKAAQTALLDLGYSLLRYKDDGKFGGETSTAIAQFRTDRGSPQATAWTRRRCGGWTSSLPRPAPRSSTTSTTRACSPTAAST